MKTSEQINELAAALAKFQLEVKPALKDSKNPFFKSNYADLSSVFEVIRKPMFDNGLSVSQLPEMSEKWGPVLTTRIMHKSGQWLEGSVGVFMTKEDPQSHASAVTYTKRIALVASLGLSTTDDDAEAAMGRPQEPTQKPSIPTQEHSVKGPVKNLAPQSEAEICSACGGELRFSEKKKVFYCANFADKSRKHDYLTQELMDNRKKMISQPQLNDWPSDEDAPPF